MHEVVYESDKVTIKDVIDEALARDDKRVYILVNGETASVSIEPFITDDGPYWLYTPSVISMDESSISITHSQGNYRCGACGSYHDKPSTYCPSCGEKLKGVKDNE